MSIAKSIRDFFDVLFPHRTVLQLNRELEETRRERDYFRGRCERLELRLLPDPVARVVRTTGAAEPAGRKTFGQLQRENAERIKQEIERVAQAAAAKGLQ